jgi:hypothetical protein
MGGNRAHCLGPTDDTLSKPNGYVAISPLPYILCWCGPSYYGGEPCSAIASVMDSTITYHQLPTLDGTPMPPTLSLHWLTQPSSSPQSSRQGTILPPLTNTGGASYTNHNIHHIVTSNLTSLLTSIIVYNLLNSILYSLPPNLYLW